MYYIYNGVGEDLEYMYSETWQNKTDTPNTMSEWLLFYTNSPIFQLYQGSKLL